MSRPTPRRSWKGGCECGALRKGSLWPKRLLLFDRCEGGIGIARRAHAHMAPLLRTALELMRSCPCRDGCVLCVHTSQCPEYNAGTDKRAAVAIVERLLRAPTPEPDDAPHVGPVGPSTAAPRCYPCARSSADAAASSSLAEPTPAEAVEPETMLGRSIRRLRHSAPAVERY